MDSNKLQEIDSLLEWLCTGPMLTTIRVNFLKTTKENMKRIITECFYKKYPNELLEFLEHCQVPELIGIKPIQKCSLHIPKDQQEIIVDASCGAALLRGANIYAPGVLAMPSGTKGDDFVSIYADLAGKCRKGVNSKYESGIKTFIGNGRVKMQRYQLFGENLNPQGVAVEMNLTLFGVPSLGDNYLPSGDALLQNLPSIICSKVLNPQSGDIVLDMCAAPGNKTTHLVELMKDDGIVIALDKTLKKIKMVKDKIDSLGYTSVQCFAFDSTKSVDRAIKSPTDLIDFQNGPPFPVEAFDKILLDAPCSALGNRPLLSSSLSPKMLQSYPALQKRLIHAAVQLLRPDGILVYSTCTVTEAENEGIVSWALQKFPQLHLIPAEPLLGNPGWENTGLNDEQRFMVQRFGPRCERSPEELAGSMQWQSNDLFHDTVGFFIAKFYKSSIIN